MTFVQSDTTQKVNVTLATFTDQQQPVDVSPAPVWSVESGGSDPATLIVAADGFSADLVSSSTPGDTIILVQASVKGVPVSGEITYTVTASAVTGDLVFTAAAPVPKAPTTVAPK